MPTAVICSHCCHARPETRGLFRGALASAWSLSGPTDELSPLATAAATAVDDDDVEIQDTIGTRALEEQSSPHHPLISGEERELLRGEWSDG
ncbi:hypothetical protein MTO96_006890 [Rhipicephalus appendiculatus]